MDGCPFPFPFPAHQIGGRNLDKKEEDEKMCRTKKASKIRKKKDIHKIAAQMMDGKWNGMGNGQWK
jgi:hypothetical protein